jgi:tRNA dimethylallyltransferase
MSKSVDRPLLVVLTGPTASGKTALAVELAQEYSCSIVSADSRQVFQELAIGSAAPSKEEMQNIPHYFIGSHSIKQPFNAGIYASECLDLLKRLFLENPIQILCGGTGLYIQALLHGLNELPEADKSLRAELENSWKDNPEKLINELKQKDPLFAEEVDLNNSRRVIRALEVIRLSGMPYSNQRTGEKKELFFKSQCFALMAERAELYARINKRTPIMIEQGWLEEARNLVNFRHLNALQTVGYKELFEVIDGKMSLPEAIEMIQMNTRRYAKRQITWIRNQLECDYLKPEEAVDKIKSKIAYLT